MATSPSIELSPRLLSESAAASPVARRGYAPLRVDLAEHCRSIAGLKGDERCVDWRKDRTCIGFRRGNRSGGRQGLRSNGHE